MQKKSIYYLLIALALCSCVSRKKIVYLQNNLSNNITEYNSQYNPTLKKDDLLMIVVSASDNEAAQPFNLPIISILTSGNFAGTAFQYQLYLVDGNGNIDFPILGMIKVDGVSKLKFIADLKESLKKYVKDPIITVKIMNYKIAVTGEVLRPGNFNITSDRVTLLDAIALAGDLTIYGRRDNIIVIREINGVKTINRIDITKEEFLKSDFYYLTQNDVVYVEPNKTKINSSVVGPNAAVIISSLSLLITVIAIFKK